MNELVAAFIIFICCQNNYHKNTQTEKSLLVCFCFSNLPLFVLTIVAARDSTSSADSITKFFQASTMDRKNNEIKQEKKSSN